MVYLWIAIGSALGGMARYASTLAGSRWWGPDFPWGTIGINVLGSLVIGWAQIATAVGERLGGNGSMRAFIMVGICGGYTTFSSFSLQTVILIESGRYLAAVGNVAISVIACVVATMAGMALASAMR